MDHPAPHGVGCKRSQLWQTKKENGSLLACPVQPSTELPLDKTGVYYLGDYFQSFSFWPCACGSDKHHKDWLNALQPHAWPKCGVDSGLNQPEPLILSYAHLFDLHSPLFIAFTEAQSSLRSPPHTATALWLFWSSVFYVWTTLFTEVCLFDQMAFTRGQTFSNHCLKKLSL